LVKQTQSGYRPFSYALSFSVPSTNAVVHGRVRFVKTEYAEDELPLDPEFATVLLEWKRRTDGSQLVFTSPVTGRHFLASPAQQDYLRPAGWCLVECPHCGAQIGKRCMDTDGETPVVHEERRAVATKNKLDNVGWHTFRHTYRSWLDDTGAPHGRAAESDAACRHLHHGQVRWRAYGIQAQAQYNRGSEGFGECVI
jgi:integrase